MGQSLTTSFDLDNSSPARGDKQAAPNAPLTYSTPFVLRTSDGNGYSLNNKVSGIRDGVTLHQMGIKGEMFLAVEKDGFTPDTVRAPRFPNSLALCRSSDDCLSHAQIVHSGDADVRLSVVDSNRIRKTYNQPLALFQKTKSDAPEGFVGCGVTKGSKPLVFTIDKLEGKTRTCSFVKNADAIANDPAKADELSRADRVDSDASEMDARSRHGSLVSQTSMSVMAPASPTAGPVKAEEPEAVAPPTTDESTTNSPPASSVMERSAASEREAEHSTTGMVEAAVDGPTPTPAKDATAVDAEIAPATETSAKAAEPNTIVESPMSPTESTSAAEVVISEAFTATSDAPATAATMTTVSSTTIVEEDPDEAEISAKGTCVGLGGGSGCTIM